jgi:quercetin dioxygenase-like cupin family protein
MPVLNRPLKLPKGDSMEILETAAMTGGAYTRVRLLFKPGGSRVPLHRHLLQDETYEVISGTVTYKLNGKIHQAAAGTTVTLPKGVPHEHYTIGPEDAVSIQTITPALDFDVIVENLFGLGSEGRGVNPIDALLQGLVWIRKMRGPFYLAMPIWLQRGLAAIVTPVAYLFGYRAVYQRFSGEEW